MLPGPFRSTVIAQPAWRRLIAVLVILAALWLAILWAVALP
ncbi:hypothetical protein [Breoghania sp.]|nr:hypothetical protein [Breoghania sp.]MDJ0931193.1 hypothetical protein [Breoghania sp.]